MIPVELLSFHLLDVGLQELTQNTPSHRSYKAPHILLSDSNSNTQCGCIQESVVFVVANKGNPNERLGGNNETQLSLLWTSLQNA